MSAPSSPPLGYQIARRHSLALFVLLLACYGYFFPRWADWNQNSRFDLVLALVDDRTVTIDKYVANTGDYAFFRGHHYSDKAPGMALLGAPVYAAFRALLPASAASRLQAAAGESDALGATLRRDGSGLTAGKLYFFAALTFTTFVAVAVPSAALGVLFLSIAGTIGLGVQQRWAAAALFGLATSAFPYANAFVGHQTAAFLLVATFAILVAVRSGGLGRAWLLAGGFLLGYAALTEYPTVLIAALLGVYALVTLSRRLETLAYLAAGALPPLVALAAYDYVAFGTLLPIGYMHSALWTDVHYTGFLSLTYPRLDALWGITFGVHRGLFFLSPFLLFAVPGYVTLWRDRARRPEFWVLLLAPLSFLLFNASSAMWSGGFAVGPRYLVPSLPFLALVAGLGVAQAWRQVFLRPVVVLAVSWSFFAVWAETIAGQSFPDYTPNPLFDLSLPRLVAGDVARNAGMLLGLSGWASLLPLVAFVVVVLAFAASSWAKDRVPSFGAPQPVESGVRWASQ